jgi:hypothetical protein
MKAFMLFKKDMTTNKTMFPNSGKKPDWYEPGQTLA